MAADAHEKLAAAHQAAQVAGSDSAGAAAAASDAAVAGIDKPLTAAGKQRTSGEPAAAPHASAGPVAAPNASSDPALVGIEKPIGVASSQVADTKSAAVASASIPAANAAAGDGQLAAGGQDAASAAAPGSGDTEQQQLLSQRVCGSPAIDGWGVCLIPAWRSCKVELQVPCRSSAALYAATPPTLTSCAIAASGMRTSSQSACMPHRRQSGGRPGRLAAAAARSWRFISREMLTLTAWLLLGALATPRWGASDGSGPDCFHCRGRLTKQRDDARVISA